MVCLFHRDYGPPDPAFNLNSGSTGVVDAKSLNEPAISGKQRPFSGTFFRVSLFRGAIKATHGSTRMLLAGSTLRLSYACFCPTCA